MVQDCNQLLVDFREVALFYVKRLTNELAYKSARASYNYYDRQFDEQDVTSELNVCLPVL